QKGDPHETSATAWCVARVPSSIRSGSDKKYSPKRHDNLRIMKPIVLVLLFAMTAMSAVSQMPAQKSKFEVASIKRSTVLPVPAEILQQISFLMRGSLKGGRLVARGVTVRGLMRAAYAPVSADANPLLEGQIVGRPAWTSTDFFDIEAKAES